MQSIYDEHKIRVKWLSSIYWLDNISVGKRMRKKEKRRLHALFVFDEVFAILLVESTRSERTRERERENESVSPDRLSRSVR